MWWGQRVDASYYLAVSVDTRQGTENHCTSPILNGILVSQILVANVKLSVALTSPDDLTRGTAAGLSAMRLTDIVISNRRKKATWKYLILCHYLAAGLGNLEAIQLRYPISVNC